MPTRDRAPDDGTSESRSQDDRRGAVAGQVSADRRPALSQELTDRLRAYGSLETIAAGDLLYQPGDDRYDLIVIESGRVDLLRDSISDQAPVRIAEMGPGDFLGELSLFTGERMFIAACAREPGTIYRIGPQSFRQLMAQDAELSDIILTASYSRRGLLKTALADTVEILDQWADAGQGSTGAAGAHRRGSRPRLFLGQRFTRATAFRGAHLSFRRSRVDPAHHTRYCRTVTRLEAASTNGGQRGFD